MKLDFSTILLIILCVIPGLFAQRSRNSVCPKSFDDQGASAELGELVALGISTHGVLVCLGACLASLLGIWFHHKIGYYFRSLDEPSFREWFTTHPSETLFFGTTYMFFSFVVSYWLGLFYGVWRQDRLITTTLLKKSKLLQRLGVTGLMGERPIIYEALNPRVDPEGTPFLVFVEVEMKDGAGFYSGQLDQFSIVRDEEPHKSIFLINVYFRKTLFEEYADVLADGVMLDLADAVKMSVKQVLEDGATHK